MNFSVNSCLNFSKNPKLVPSVICPRTSTITSRCLLSNLPVVLSENLLAILSEILPGGAQKIYKKIT